jgi:choline transport protein
MISSIWRGKNQPRGPFNLGIIGVVSKVITVVFCSFTVIMYSFPYVMPVTPSSTSPTKSFKHTKQTLIPKDMNYITVIYGIALVYGSIDWFSRARYQFRVHKSEPRSNELCETSR